VGDEDCDEAIGARYAVCAGLRRSAAACERDAPCGIVAEIEDEELRAWRADGEVCGARCARRMREPATELRRQGNRTASMGIARLQCVVVAVMGVYSSVGSVPALEWKSARRAGAVSSGSQG